MVNTTGSIETRGGMRIAAKPRPAGLLPQLFARLGAWRRMRRDAALLHSQPDYLLRDIGIGRSQIEAAVRLPLDAPARAWRER